ncbi:MAG TPA: EAL domain-containing protein [Thermoanaerobaculia bacterium]|jgi:diguanylate cyclase (GGDEF)-like protein/PAS domain S-box-containing protein|nr:EAL domain-containing protein [Thermoanaerobaculia bacterium]
MNRFEGEILRNLLAQTTRAYDDQLGAIAAEKEIAQVTLASIGDGVLATDARGRVELLNPVAEELAGWSAEEAAGLPVAEVLRLIDESTGREIEHPIERCLASGQSLRLTERIALQRRDGRRHAVECTCAPIRDRQGAQVGAVLVFQDVTEKRLLALQLAHQATHDGLTGLFNRVAFNGHLQRALEETRRTGVPHALAYMDLDQFKLVNDTCGHLAGDELLHRVTEMLQTSMRASDIVARLGGDEFAWLSLYSPLETAERQIAKFHRELQGFRFAWQDKSFSVGISIGLVPITEEFASVAHLMSAADHACYVAKEKGRNRIQVYRPDTAEFVRRDADMNWVLRIQETLERDRFRLFAQEIRPLTRREGGGLRFEVLLRMISEGGQIHLPSDFIRAAERYGLMRSIDRWVIGRSLETFAAESPAWLEGLALCSINLSAVSIGDETFLDFVEERLAATGFPAKKLCFEITETAAIDNLQQAVRLLGRLGARGVRFALDDFGSGMASYAYLKELPVSFLKIDGKFIQDIVTDPLDRAMVESINQVGHVMGLETIAESVGSLAAVNQLRALGVDYGQGHWISPPRPLSALREIASAS